LLWPLPLVRLLPFGLEGFRTNLPKKSVEMSEFDQETSRDLSEFDQETSHDLFEFDLATEPGSFYAKQLLDSNIVLVVVVVFVAVVVVVVVVAVVEIGLLEDFHLAYCRLLEMSDLNCYFCRRQLFGCLQLNSLSLNLKLQGRVETL
jgi:hypothetical protein